MAAILPLPTRSAALARLTQFLPQAGRAYTAGRNIDPGPGLRESVSGLSPWIRHRMLTEEQVLRAVLTRHTQSQAARFIEEVCWRSYFKGYLESRPSIWSDYRRMVVGSFSHLPRCQAAMEGRTGIDCFDAWVAELKTTGYLHNHARMCFASIWIFTLELPWQLGADFTLRHFIDGDAASNTLSWRWVAGLHTPGKNYLAKPAAIERCSNGRFAPQGLVEQAAALQEVALHPIMTVPPLATAAAPGALPPGRIALLLTEEDLHPESLGLHGAPLVGVAGASAVAARSALPVSALASEFVSSAMDDALARAGAHFDVPAERLSALDGDAIAEWAQRIGAEVVLTAVAPVGPVEEALRDAADWLTMQRLPLVQVRREWDALLWPLATRGFFDLREQIPRVIAELDLERDRPAQNQLPF
jgi:deoxyribodipyrimidine photo-lyase